MSVRIDQKDLVGAVRTRLPRLMLNAAVAKEVFPGVDVVDQEGKVIAPMVRHDVPCPLADQMQFLFVSQPVPRAGKRKRRPRQRRQLQDVLVKRFARRQVGDVQGDVIEMHDPHGAYRSFWAK